MPLHNPCLETHSTVAWHASHHYDNMADEGFGERLVERQPSDSPRVSQGACPFDDAHLLGDLVEA